MGSIGTGRLSDYTGHARQPNGQGGSSGQDRCAKAFSAPIEDVDRSDYFKQFGQPPGVGAEVRVEFDRRPRVTTTNGTLIGFLPTSFNYLRTCIEAGYSYIGYVTVSRQGPVSVVQVDIQPVVPV
jgi:hypothetical protein